MSPTAALPSWPPSIRPAPIFFLLLAACRSAPIAESFELERLRMGGVTRVDAAAALLLSDARAKRSMPSMREHAGQASPEATREALDRLDQVIHAYPFFARVMTLHSPDPGDPGAALVAAREAGAGLLVEVRVISHQAAFVDHRGWWAAFFWWWYAWVPSWWVKDELYEVSLVLRVDIHDTTTGNLVLSDNVEGRAEDLLDDFERGWIFQGLWRVPGALGPSNWEAVLERLGPEAEARLHDGIVRLVHRDLKEVLEKP